MHPSIKRLEESDVGSRLARGVFWSLAGFVISRGLMLCAMILVARALGITAYGELGIVQSTISMFGAFAGFGLGLTATKYVAEFRVSDPERAGRLVGLSVVFAVFTGGLIAVGLLIFAPWLAENTINAPHLVGVLRIGAFILFIEALNGALTGALSGFEAFKVIARVNLLVGLFSFPVILCGTYLGGLTGTVSALAVNLGVCFLLNLFTLRIEAQSHKVPITVRNCTEEGAILWAFSLPAVLAGVMVGPVSWVCSAMLVNQPNGYGEMGIYSASNQWYAVLMFLPSMIGRVLLPILSGQIGQVGTGSSRKTVILAIKMNIIIVIPLVTVASIFSQPIMSFYGEQFADGWLTLVVVLVTAGIVAIQAPVGQVIAATGKMWIGFWMNFGWAAVFISLTFLLIDFGAVGLALARLLSYIVHSVWTFWFAILLLRNTGID